MTQSYDGLVSPQWGVHMPNSIQGGAPVPGYLRPSPDILGWISRVTAPFLIANLVAELYHAHFCGALGIVTAEFNEYVAPIIHRGVAYLFSLVGFNALPAAFIDYIAVGIFTMLMGVQMGLLADVWFFLRHERSRDESWITIIFIAFITTPIFIACVLLFWPIVLFMSLVEALPFIGPRIKYWELRNILSVENLGPYSAVRKWPSFRRGLRAGRIKNLVFVFLVSAFLAGLFLSGHTCIG
jgi:hypothetical protein